MDTEKLAQLLFANTHDSVQEIENRFAPRTLKEGARVTRMAPSPTGFMHLGNLYGAIADERLAHQSGGVFYLRIEDTDKKREVEGGVETILSVFKAYELPFDEGACEEGERGQYGPYYQRKRKDIYHVFVKELVRCGKAYPCFLTQEELATMREEQEAKKLDFGCYGSFARYRNCPYKEVERRIQNGESYVLRYRSEGKSENRIKVGDVIRGALELYENIQDVVLLKHDGIPTYHFAHVVDDHLMRTNLVVRGEEWLATLPIHVQLFAALGWTPPKYLHTAHLMKQEGTGKRKLSKRKDPELALGFYSEMGYPTVAVKEYLMTLLNSNFEDWRLANPNADINDFSFSAKKMSVSGALFDICKLDDVSKTVISRMDAHEVLSLLLSWCQQYDVRFAHLLSQDKVYAEKILAVGRTGTKRRKDLTIWREAKTYLCFYYDELFEPCHNLPKGMTNETALAILKAYTYDPNEEADAWFTRLKSLAESVGYAANMKDYKKNPEAFAGHVGDVSMLLRLAVTGREQSPDLHEIMQLLGEERVNTRLLQMQTALLAPTEDANEHIR